MFTYDAYVSIHLYPIIYYIYIHIVYIYIYLLSMLAAASMQFTPYAYTQYTCIRRQKVGEAHEAHRKGPFRSHTRTHPALPLVAQATKVAGIAGDHLPVTSLVLSSNKEHTNKIHAKFLYSQFIPSILFVQGWGIGYITAVHRFLASANMFPNAVERSRFTGGLLNGIILKWEIVKNDQNRLPGPTTSLVQEIHQFHRTQAHIVFLSHPRWQHIKTTSEINIST